MRDSLPGAFRLNRVQTDWSFQALRRVRSRLGFAARYRLCRVVLLLWGLLFVSFSPGFSTTDLVVAFRPGLAVKAQTVKGKLSVRATPALEAFFLNHPPEKLQPLLTQRAFSLPDSLANVYLIRFASEERAADLVQRLAGTHEVLWAEENHAYPVLLVPPDPFQDQQWYLPAIQAAQAWQLTRGSDQVVVGVIDTGIDYRHPELAGRLWVNEAEDLNRNGTLDSTDLNGLDDDGNGYVDDVIGWDFVNAPAFPDQGDYLDPDNDPMDEFQTGHGTPVAGIIAALSGNGIGMSGIAPGVKVMALRAGTASGLLEEDDVAEAILYAVANGCQVVNMSFGDRVFSHLLQQVIRFGTSRGVLFVAAAGNSGNTVLHYPAALSETISVGATEPGGGLAGFSTFGTSLDLVAPGQEIFSLQIGGGFGVLNGTSFAAPMVSAALALLKSQFPNAPPLQLKAALLAGARDLFNPGWDQFSGHGQLNVYRSLKAEQAGLAQILKPQTGSGVSGHRVAILGTVFGPRLLGYTLLVGTGENPAAFQPLASHLGSRILADTVAVWNLDGWPDTTYTLSLRLQQRDLPEVVSHSVVVVDRTPPRLRQLQRFPMLRGDRNALLLKIHTDDPTRLQVNWEPGGAVTALPTRQRIHYLLEDERKLPSAGGFRLLLRNAADLTGEADSSGLPFAYHLPPFNLQETTFDQRAVFPVQGYLCPCLPDFDRDGVPEVVLSRSSETQRFGPLAIYGWENGSLVLRSQTAFPGIPRDAGRIFSDGPWYVLAGYGGTTLLLSHDGSQPFPDQIVWLDSTDFWGSRLTNLDADPQLELLAIHHGQWGIYEWEEAPLQAVERQALPNPTAGQNRYGIPHILVTDLDADGLVDLCFVDLDNDLLHYEREPAGDFLLVDTLRLPGQPATHLLAALDVDGDGLQEVVAGTLHRPEELSEASFVARYHELSLWSLASPGQPHLLRRWYFHGLSAEVGTRSGLTVSDLDGDGRADLLFSYFPHLYWLQNTGGMLEPAWHFEPVNSNAALVFDWLGNGAGQFLTALPDGLALFSGHSQVGRPAPPSRLVAVPLDTERIRLSWQAVPQASRYRIYRRSQSREFTLLDSTSQTAYLDEHLMAGVTYQYAVTSVNPDLPVQESLLSRTAAATPNPPPRLISQQVVDRGQIRLRFSEPMGPAAFEAGSYRLQAAGLLPAALAREENGRAVLLGFVPVPETAKDTLLLIGLGDRQGTPLQPETLKVAVRFPQAAEKFYLISAVIQSRTEIRLQFNRPVDAQSAADTAHYRFQPALQVQQARVDEANPSQVHLQVDPANRLGALGVPYLLQISGLVSSDSLELDSTLTHRIELLSTVSSLKQAFVYPNPYRVSQAEQPLRFARIPENSRIFIYNSSGHLIRRLEATDATGAVSWDLRNEFGQTVGSGVYFFRIYFGEERKQGKFLLIR
ncbi:MAG: hypothetical protein D6715_02645 [Calditrichaeota bacterium]|nr:MAG: hypothetical protein D6715_02645 [Calditrichota bacterium]